MGPPPTRPQIEQRDQVNWEEELGMADTKDIVAHRGPQSSAFASEIRIDLALPCRSLVVVVAPHRLETGGPPWARTEC